MQNHNQAGKRHGGNGSSGNSQAQRNQAGNFSPQHHDAGRVKIDIPTTVEAAIKANSPALAVQQKECRPTLGFVRLRGFGSEGYMTFGRALVIAHNDGTVTIDSVVLPFRPGPVERNLRLRPENLQEGDHFEVITIMKMLSGVWFIRQHAMGYQPRHTGEQPAKHYFPMIRDHLESDERRGQLLLNQLTTFTGIKFDLEDMAEYRQYMELPFGVYNDMHQLVNDERVAARNLLEKDDIKEADALFSCMQVAAGYTMPPSARRPRIDDQEQVDTINAEVGPRIRKERMDTIGDVAAEHAATTPAPKPVVVQPVVKRPAWMELPARR